MEAMGVSLQLNPAAVGRHHPLKSTNCGLHDEMIVGGGGRSLGGGTEGGGVGGGGRSLGGGTEGGGVGGGGSEREEAADDAAAVADAAAPAPPPLPKLGDDGNPKFVIFIRPAEAYLWEPLTLVNGGTTTKIMVAAKDNFLGKYIYKDTLARNLAAVVYKDEKEIRKKARKQFPSLQSVKEFRYGYELVVCFHNPSPVTKTMIYELHFRKPQMLLISRVKKN